MEAPVWGADLWTIFVAAIGFGAGGEGFRRYRRFKNRRCQIAPEVRNAGFWTDGRLYLAEFAFCALFAGIPWTAITLAVWTNGSFVYSYAALLTYPAFILLLMRGLNVGEA